MSYTKNYVIDLMNLELELDFILDNYCPYEDEQRVIELRKQIKQMKEAF